MSGLVINGIDVPLTPDSGAVGSEELGSRRRTASGRLALARRGHVRTLGGSLALMRREEARAWEGLLRGLGDAWRFDLDGPVANLASGRLRQPLTAENVSTRRAEIIAESTTVEYRHPKFGDSCIALESATTNLFSSNVATGTDTGGNTTGFAAIGSASLSSSTVAAWEGERSLRVQCSASAQGARAAYTAAGSMTLFASVYLRGSSGEQVMVRLAQGGSSESKTIALSSEWKRVEVGPLNVSAGPVNFDIMSVTGANTFYADGFQLEEYLATSWVDGSRGQPDLSYRLPFLRQHDDLTFMMWIRLTSDFNQADLPWIVCDDEPTVGFVSTEGDIGLMVPGEPVAGYVPGYVFPGWKHVAGIIRRSPQSGSAGLELWVDGVLAGSDSIPEVNFVDPVLDFADAGTYGGVYGSLIDDLVILPYALTGEQIAAYVASNRPWSELPTLDVWGDLVARPASAPLAMRPKAPPRLSTTTGRAPGASGIEVMHGVTFELEEVAP